MHQISPYSLWLGNAGDCRDTAKVLNAGIRAVVQLAIEEPLAQFPRETIVIRIPLYDGAGNSAEDLRLAVATLESLIRTSTPTLLCCSMGMSRTPAIAALVIARVGSCDPYVALEQLAKIIRTDVSPAFWDELLATYAT